MNNEKSIEVTHNVRRNKALSQTKLKNLLNCNPSKRTNMKLNSTIKSKIIFEFE